MHSTLFEINNLKKSFGKIDVLKGIDFDIQKGEILGIIGKSGSGKSTILKIISGLVKFDKGSIRFNRTLVENKRQNQISGFSFQPYSFYDELSLLDNVMYFGTLYGLSKKQILKKTNDLINLTDLKIKSLKIIAKNLSGGMKKRFDLVCALLHDPKVLLLDEPTSGLDPLRRKQILRIIRRINKLGVTIILSSHNMGDINDICDRVLLINNGKKLVLDTPEMIKSQLLEHEEIIVQSYPGNYEKLKKHLSAFSILYCKIDNKYLHIFAPETEILVHFILHLLEKEGEVLENILVLDADLSDVFELYETHHRTKLVKENVKRVNDFIYSLIGKNYPPKKIKKIMISHKWPSEIVEVLVGKQVVQNINRGK